jgi:hypothetical protein
MINPFDELVTLCEQKKLDVWLVLLRRVDTKSNRPAIMRLTVAKGKTSLVTFDQDEFGNPPVYELADVAMDYLEDNGVL